MSSKYTLEISQRLSISAYFWLHWTISKFTNESATERVSAKCGPCTHSWYKVRGIASFGLTTCAVGAFSSSLARTHLNIKFSQKRNWKKFLLLNVASAVCSKESTRLGLTRVGKRQLTNRRSTDPGQGNRRTDSTLPSLYHKTVMVCPACPTCGFFPLFCIPDIFTGYIYGKYIRYITLFSPMVFIHVNYLSIGSKKWN